MRCDEHFKAYVEDMRMAGDGEDDDAFVRRASAIFASELFKPMFQRATVSPEAVRALIGEFRDKLDALDTVIAACPEGGGGPGVRVARNRFGVGVSGLAGAGAGIAENADGRDGLDDVGRNQRSRLRELAILEALARESRPFALQQLTGALEARGFADTSGAIVSQLHRLKKLGVINQPANGMYEITDDGLGHMRRLKSSFGALLTNG